MALAQKIMRREISFRRNWKVAITPSPASSLTDGIVTVRLPIPGDAPILAGYGANRPLLDGMWVGHPDNGTDVNRWAEYCINEWLSGWQEQGSDLGPAFIVDEHKPFVGIVNLFPRPENVLELLYGTLPTARGRGIAARAVNIVANWGLRHSQFSSIELRIGEGNIASLAVAQKCNFQFVEKFETFVTGTGKTHIDYLFVRTDNPGGKA